MTWQKIAKQNNLDISVISITALEENTRIDAEYYRPEYLVPYRKGLKLIPIGDVLTKCQYGISQEMNEEEIGVEIYRMNELENGLCKDSDLKFVNINEKKTKFYRLKPNDILFNRVNSIQFVGRTAIYKHEDRKRVFASYLIRLNTNGNEVLPDYLNIFLNCKYGRKELVRKARWAVNQANVNAEELKRIGLPIASALLQKKVEKTVNQAHSLLVSARDTYEKAEQQLLKEINLTDYKPSGKNISIRSFAECLKDDRFDAEYWQPDFDGIISIVSKYKKGVSTIDNEFRQVKNNFKKDQKGTYKYIEISDVNISTGEVDFNEIIGAELPANAKIKFGKRQIITSKVRPNRGATAILDNHENYIGSGAFTVLEEKGHINLETLMAYLKTKPIRELLLRYNTGTSYPTITDSDILQLPIPRIDAGIQKQIKEKISKSHTERQEAKNLLEKAKWAVEIFIEQDEEKALKYLKQ